MKSKDIPSSVSVPVRPGSGQVDDLRRLYRSASRMARTDDADVLFNYLVEDLSEGAGLERIVVLSLDESDQTLKSRVFYGFGGVVQDVSINFSSVNGLLRKVYTDREPLNILRTSSARSVSPGEEVKFGVLRDAYPGRKGSRRQRINCCIDTAQGCDDVIRTYQPFFMGYQVIVRSTRDRTVESLIGASGSFIILPLCDANGFYGYALGDKPVSAAPVSYEEARIASAIAAHSSLAIGRALRQRSLLDKIERQHRELKEAHGSLAGHMDEMACLKGFYESIIQNLRSGLLAVDQYQRITHLNRAAEVILGVRREDLLGEPLEKVIFKNQKVRKCLFLDKADEIVTGEGYLLEMDLRRGNGEVFPAEVCFSIITGGDGEITGLSCIFRDITERKALDQKLARVDRLASLGELAAGVAHEIKNPLAGIAGALQILARGYGPEDPNREVFDEVFNQVKRLDGFVNNLLQFARPSKPVFLPLKLEEVVRSALFLVSKQIERKRIALDLDFGDQPPLVDGDKGLLQQVFLNIILNAVDAMRPGGTLEIHTCWKDRAERCMRSRCLGSFVRDGNNDTAKVVIRDNGPGISPEVLENIFNPFYTTKSHGTGLGLPISHRIIEQHNGAILVESEPGAGAVFTVCIPVVQKRGGGQVGCGKADTGRR